MSFEDNYYENNRTGSTLGSIFSAIIFFVLITALIKLAFELVCAAFQILEATCLWLLKTVFDKNPNQQQINTFYATVALWVFSLSVGTVLAFATATYIVKALGL